MLYRLTILIFILFPPSLFAQPSFVTLKGRVVDDKTNIAIEGVVIKLSNSVYFTTSNKQGEFALKIPKKLTLGILFSHLSYQSLLKEIKTKNADTVVLNIALNRNYNLMNEVPVYSLHKPETLVAKPFYSVYDFDFYEDKLILLTAERSLHAAKIQVSDYEGHISSSADLPKFSGEANHFFHDYEGYTDVICSDTIFRLDLYNNSLVLQPVKRDDFNKYVLPVSDTMNGNYYYTNKWEKYPSFNYYYLKAKDSISHVLNTISNADLLKLYNLEYYYLPSRMQLEVRRMADYYKTDKHIIAALMSGFTQSMYYEPLYAPLFILKDTICIFNHHNDLLFHYDKQNNLIDSVAISYHHPKNWREWKKKLFVDESQNKVYAFFSKDGHHYLKQINYQTGKEILTYKLKQHSAEKIKIRDGYVYYVYRPFGSTQERFLYRERIE